ncbi:extracellular solute-binding protein [Sphingomonas sp. PAMC 26617]|uniref:extracellular solute-binding protein n=1 Tax=Sphingomonas sp. PAMC 26617 TaxID=1112216 RepID=UPI000287C857|nr:extracellular solute-binding protein [Sphingomonas sp. PAMC 26617]
MYHGLTWDHPRGYAALDAAAAKTDGLLVWDRQPLEGFEAHPIAEVCAHYDLVVLDHPHIGEAVAARCLRPLEDVFGVDEIATLRRETIGPCLSSYHYAQRHWALPLDAATQVMAYRADLLDGPEPTTWDTVVALPERIPVALSLAGPHAALTLWSIVASFGTDTSDADLLIDVDAGLSALDIMARIAARTPDAVRALNPIGLLAAMAAGDTIALCPLVYGYVNYAPTITFADAPRAQASTRPGSTLGGTGIGVSARCNASPALLDHLRWLMSAEAQIRFIPDHEGQPSRRAAWHDDAVNKRWGNFYRATAATLKAAHVRPRHDGAIAFQTAASAAIRDALAQGQPHRVLLDDLQRRYAASRQPGAER